MPHRLFPRPPRNCHEHLFVITIWNKHSRFLFDVTGINTSGMQTIYGILGPLIFYLSSLWSNYVQNVLILYLCVTGTVSPLRAYNFLKGGYMSHFLKATRTYVCTQSNHLINIRTHTKCLLGSVSNCFISTFPALGSAIRHLIAQV